MNKLVILLGATALVLPTLSAATLRKTHATISEATARSKALARVPHGAVKSAELEHEHGRLIYSFDISRAGKAGIEEVQIDARTGKLVSQKHETAMKEHREAMAEAKEHARKK